jgi:rhodanese-related sulfurtransferase
MPRLLLLTALLLLALPACGSKDTASSAEGSGSRRDVDIHQLKSTLESGKITLFDVRTRSEHYAAHIPEATLLPYAELTAGRRAEVEAARDEEIWLICESGGRSSKAADLLVSEGYSVVNVTGGHAAWIAAGYPVD